jgi:NAD(P)-dependent dehydrogenase (short-subunit alcohol dehydrogenase family)
VGVASGGRLSQRRALVTGASRGIGKAIAVAFLREGAAVAAVARDADRLEQAWSEAREAGEVVHAVAVDLSDAAAVERAVRRVHELLGRIDCVVNAAAIDCPWVRTGEMPVESWDETIAVNLSGTFYVCRAALPFMVDGGGGAVVNVTSVAAHRVWPRDVAYSVSKAGVDMLTRTIAVEYGADGIRANSLAPGVIDAGMTDVVTDAAERSELTAMHPVGRMGHAEEVAEAAVWLASDASSFTTGTTLAVDGGFLA